MIQGTSGSGKSTLLNCIGGLDVVDSGSIQVDGQEMVGLKMDALSDYRRDYLGFIFQFYNLIPNLTVRENIQVCEYLTDQPLDMDELLCAWTHRASEQIPIAVVRWTAAALRDCPCTHQESEASALR